MVTQSHIFKNNAATIVKRVRDRTRYRMELYMNEERRLVSTKAPSLLKKDEAVKAKEASKLDTQEPTENKNDEPWCFTHF